MTVVALLLVAAGAGSAQFGLGLKQEWTDFHDPAGRFSLRVPPRWAYQAELSTDDFFVFYGPGDYDLFYVEILAPSGSAAPAAQAEEALRRYRGAGGLPDFRLVHPPTPGSLADKEASFMVYSYTDGGGTDMVEGRAFLEHGGRVFTLAFADEAARFDDQVPTFNTVMESLVLADVPSRPGLGAGFGVGSGTRVQGAQGTQGTQGTGTKSSPSEAAADSSLYTSPGDFYRFAVPEGWELWEEQATARGDTIEPWNGVVPWSGKPVTKTLFLWDYFDEWEQKGAQYETVLAVVENVPGTLNEALETLKDYVMGDFRQVYTTSTRRARIGGQSGVAADIVVRPGMVEPWSIAPQWYRTVTFYAFKQGSTLFLWVIPKEIEDHPAVGQAMESFQWLHR